MLRIEYMVEIIGVALNQFSRPLWIGTVVLGRPEDAVCWSVKSLTPQAFRNCR